MQCLEMKCVYSHSVVIVGVLGFLNQSKCCVTLLFIHAYTYTFVLNFAWSFHLNKPAPRVKGKAMCCVSITL